MRNYAEELEKRAAFVKKAMEDAGASGIIFNNSGGKDCTLAGAICMHACKNTGAYSRSLSGSCRTISCAPCSTSTLRSSVCRA